MLKDAVHISFATEGSPEFTWLCESFSKLKRCSEGSEGLTRSSRYTQDFAQQHLEFVDLGGREVKMSVSGDSWVPVSALPHIFSLMEYLSQSMLKDPPELACSSRQPQDGCKDHWESHYFCSVIVVLKSEKWEESHSFGGFARRHESRKIVRLNSLPAVSMTLPLYKTSMKCD